MAEEQAALSGAILPPFHSIRPPLSGQFKYLARSECSNRLFGGPEDKPTVVPVNNHMSAFFDFAG